MSELIGRRAPSLSGLDGWLQSPPRSLTQYRGSVLVAWFFTISSPECMAMVPELRSLRESHDDVEVLGIHSPDFARDADPRRVSTAVARAGMVWPVAMDHRRSVFTRWQGDEPVRGWPWTAVIDQQGRIVATFAGTDLTGARRVVTSLLD